MEKDHVTSEALVLVKDLLRKYPQWSQDCIAVVGNISSNNVQESKAKAALIWMLGEYSQEMHDAPYGLESLIENWDEEHSVEASTIQSISGRECGESSQTSTSATGQAPASIMAIDDLFGLYFSVGTATAPPPPPLTLNPKVVLDSGTFQQQWRQLPISSSEEYSLSPLGIASLTTPHATFHHHHLHLLSKDKTHITITTTPTCIIFNTTVNYWP
ncbi:hypothetical protein RYX36_010006 [Vicia faba]